MSGSVHHFVPRLESGAVGAHVLQLRSLTEELTGRPSYIFAGSTDAAHANKARRYREFRWIRTGPVDVLVYQMAIGSPIADMLRRRHETVVVNHHNLTPAGVLAGWDDRSVEGVVWAGIQLRQLAERAALGVAVSAYNEDQLLAYGYHRTAVAPVIVDLEAVTPVDPVPDRALSAAKRHGGADWLFVGRIAPNKCQHQVIKAFAVYRRLYDASARLWLVGGVGAPRYQAALEQFVGKVGLDDAVTITGAVPAGVLASHYRHADVFVCLSEHEGLCVPLLEAMWHRLPIVALASSAVPETLAGAGLCLPTVSGRQPEPAVVAAAVHKVMADTALRSSMIEAGAARVEHFSLERTRARYRSLLSELLSR